MFYTVLGILACFAVVVILVMPNDFLMPRDED